ncbi:peroxidase 57-like [Chenopodium quinoa]|uniref:Peroxidase n=1 Tax=Chenopodium quinoa TaxID=63459 RepID=A0A803LCZ8_CHEQI|nr:peroxidase 57-like [Chenopodium quinoa]
MARVKSSTVALALVLLLMTLVGDCYGALEFGYYKKRCTKVDAEAVVFSVVKKHFNEDKDTVADLIRLQFHDCFVRGCDASILLEGQGTEKTAPPNLSVRGFEIVEEAKVALDRRCPGIVSCADIIILAARDATFLGGASWYKVETGRKDGRISKASEALQLLPKPSIPVPQAVKLFAQHGLNTEDFVYLLGCHTVGTSHCDNFQDRLYNFHNTGKPDPAMSGGLLKSLKKTCPRNTVSNNETFLDQTKGSEFVMDNGFFKKIMKGEGILEVDQQLAIHPLTKDIVRRAAEDNRVFTTKIGPAMRKLALVGVNTNGEVRLGTCKKVR